MCLRCPFEKKAIDIEEHTKKRWTLKTEDTDTVSIGHFTICLATIDWANLLGLRYLLPSDQYRVLKSRKQARQNRLMVKS